MNRSNTPVLDNWNPMLDDYVDRTFNSYVGRAPYQNLPGLGMQQPLPRIATNGHEVFALHVRKIPVDMSEAGIRNLFSKCGDVLDVKLMLPSGILKPSYFFGKVYFRTPQEAIKGLQAYDDTPPLNLKVELDWHCFGSAGNPKANIHSANYVSGGRSSQAERNTGPGLLPTPNLTIQVQPESAARTVYAPQDRPGSSGAAQGRPGSRCNSQARAQDNFCVKCQLRGTKCCTRCKTVYCSQECQRADWEVHRHVCMSLKDNATSRSHLLETPPLPIGHHDVSSKQPAAPTPNKESKSDAHPRPRLPTSSHPNQFRSTPKPQAAFDKPGNQHHPAKSQPHGDPPQASNGPRSRQNSQHQGAGEARATGGANDRKQPWPDMVKQSHQQLPVGDMKDNAENGNNLHDESQKSNHQPLRRPKVPQMSAPKANRPVVPQKLRTMQPVAIGSSTKVKISHIDNPYSFYVQLDDGGDLGEIMRKVQVVAQAPAPKEVALGQVVAAKYSLDGIWYRAKVEKTDKDKIRVRFIDYGNDESVAMCDLRLLGPEVAELPVQAVWCRLANVRPPSGVWSANALCCFNVMTESIQLDASLLKTCGGQAWVTLKAEAVDDIGVLLMKTGSAEKSFPVHFSCLQSWETGAEITLQTPTREQSGKIWASHTAGIPPEELASLFSKLAKACSPEEDNALSEQFEAGAVVAARSPAEQAWYRGVILKADPPGYLVRYLDFGNCEKVASVRPLPDAFCQYLTLAVCFRVEEPYAAECIPDEFLSDDGLTVKVLRVTGDTALVNVQFGENSPTIQATASSVWNEEDGFDFLDTFPDDVEALEAAVQAHECQTKASERVAPVVTKCPETLPSSVVSKGLDLLPMFEIPPSPASVAPSWVESPHQLSVHFLQVDKMAAVHKLAEDLQEACLSPESAPLTKPPAVGQLVCCQFSLDDAWYRCLVEGVSDNGEVTVRFIDYGNAEATTLDKLRPLPNPFYEIPPMALTVVVAPVSGVSLEDLRLHLTPVDGEGVILLMTVTDSAANPVRAVLTDLDGLPLEDFLAGLIGSEKPEAPEEDASDMADADVALGEEPVPQAVAGQDESHLEETLQAEEHVMPGGASESHAATPGFLELTVGQTVELCIGDALAPDLIMAFEGKEDVISRYDKMAEEITEHCSKEAAADYQPKAGDFCLAKSTAYDQWYRALVQSLQDGQCKVLFPDYGNSDLVEVSNTRPITDAFREPPFQAVSCSLFGVESKKDRYSDEDCLTFKNFLTDLQTVTAEVVEKAENDFYVIRVPSIEEDLKKMGFLAN